VCLFDMVCFMGKCVCWTWRVLWVSVFVGHCVFYGRVCLLDMACFMGVCVLYASAFCG